MRLRPAVLAIAAIAALTFAGCSSDAGPGSSGAGSTGDPLVVAVPLPLTSGNATTAEQMLNSAKLAASEINAAGGAGGRELVIKEYDDLLTADESAKVAQRAITVDGAEVFIGAYTTIEGLAIRQMTDPRKILFLSPSTVSPALTDGSEYVFRTSHIQDDYPPLFAEAADELGLEKVIVIHDDGQSGATLAEPTVDALESVGIDAGTSVGYTLNATDVSTAISQVKAQNPDGVVLIGSSAADAGLIVKTLAEQGVDVSFFGLSSPVAPDAIRIGGAAYEQIPVYSVQNKHPDKNQYVEFAEKYAAEYGGTADEAVGTLAEAASQMYDAVVLLAKLIEESGGVTDGDTLRDILTSLEPYEAVSGREGSTLDFADSTQGFSKAMSTLRYNAETGFLDSMN